MKKREYNNQNLSQFKEYYQAKYFSEKPPIKDPLNDFNFKIDYLREKNDLEVKFLKVK